MLYCSRARSLYPPLSNSLVLKISCLLVFSAIFLIIRLTNLTLLPPYIDELLHISRAFALLCQQQLLIQTEGGKFLQIWLIAPVLALRGDPVWTARIVTSLVGLLSALGCYLLGKTMFQRRGVGLMAAWLYLVVPYALFLDRLVLNDGLLAMLGVYVLLFTLKLVQQASIWLTLSLGLSLALAALTKLNGSIWWIIPVVVFYVRLPRLPKGWFYVGSAYLLALVIVSPIIPLLPEQLSAPATNTWLLTAPPSAYLTALWWANAQGAWLDFQTYLTWPIWVLVLLGMSMSLVHRHKSGLLLMGLVFIYSAFFIFTSEIIYSRYLFPSIPFLLILGGYAMIKLKDGLPWLIERIPGLVWPHTETALIIIQLGLVVLLIQPALSFDYRLLFNPVQAPFETSDRWLFINSSLSGYNLDQVSAFLRAQAHQRGPIVVVRHDTPGLTREGLDLMLADAKQTIKLMTFNFYTTSPQLLTKLLQGEKRPVFVVLSQPAVPGSAPFTVNFAATPYCRQVVVFFKPHLANHITIYECTTL